MTTTAVNGSECANRGSTRYCGRAHPTVIGLIVAALVGATGCGRGSGGSAATSVSPSDAASGAIELYDKDGSGALDDSELAASPGLLAAKSRYDTDGDGRISEDEIVARLKSVFGAGSRWLTINCQILKGGRPLAGAKVRFVPEPFFGDALQTAAGTTDSQGRVHPAVDEQFHPDKLKGRNIMQPGVYRVDVEHPNVTQPHKPLGFEIDEFARGGTDAVFNL